MRTMKDITSRTNNAPTLTHSRSSSKLSISFEIPCEYCTRHRTPLAVKTESVPVSHSLVDEHEEHKQQQEIDEVEMVVQELYERYAKEISSYCDLRVRNDVLKKVQGESLAVRIKLLFSNLFIALRGLARNQSSAAELLKQREIQLFNLLKIAPSRAQETELPNSKSSKHTPQMSQLAPPTSSWK